MLDTKARFLVQPMIQKCANGFIGCGVTANQVTVGAFCLGMMVAPLCYYDYPWLALGLLWISGLLDAVDGSIARSTQTSSPWGTLLDLIFDRFVEMGIIVALGIKYPDIRLGMMFLLCSILFTMCVFLTVGALSDKVGGKSFRYQSGVMERTEGFLCFSSMILFPQYLDVLVPLTTVLIAFTALQRMVEAKRLFEE